MESNTNSFYYAFKVSKEKTEEGIKKAEKRDIYDDRRSIKSDGEYTEIPIEKPIETEYNIVKQKNPVWRKKQLPDNTPSSWKVIGDIILIRLTEMDVDEKEKIAKELLDLHSNCHTVMDYRGSKGKIRKPIIEEMFGKCETETIHKEHGYKFKLDLSKVMFSKGNEKERVRMEERVKKGEKVFDMFAGIGYFSIPIAIGGGKVYAAEINPTAYKYLEENTELNNVDIMTYNRDCREISIEADRIIMGHFNSFNYLDHGFSCIKKGGTIHLHCLGKPNEKNEKLENIKKKAKNYNYRIDAKYRKVKTYSEGLSHLVFDIKTN